MMSRFALRHPLAATFGTLVLALLVSLLYGRLRKDFRFNGESSSEPGEGGQEKSILASIFPPQLGGARFQSEPAPDFSLRDQDGRLVSLSALRGKLVLINFMLVECKEICPQTTRELKGLQESFGDRMGKQVFFLSVTVDPEHDRPEILRAYGEKNGLDFRSWRFLTGTKREIADVCKRYGVFVEPIRDPHAHGDIVHTASTFVVDPQGVIRAKLQPGTIALFGQTVIERVLAKNDG